MTPQTKRILAGLILTLLPAFAVYQAKQSVWGSFMTTPKARQKGAPNAPVRMVEFSDFQCPMCARVQPDLHKLMEMYAGKVQLAYKYFPLTRIHKNAMPAATAAECAAQQEKFWPFQDRLFETQNQWANLTDPTTVYVSIANEVQLDMARFNGCYRDPATEALVERDRVEAEARQISSTPTLFIGEERLVGTVIQTDGARTIERELRK